MLAQNLKQVEENIQAALKESTRPSDEVTLIAVSKTKPVTMMQEIYDLGIRDFGENKVQEILDKYEQMPSDTRFHMIGHLQRNKVKYIIDKVVMIHSVDSLRLAETIDKEAAKKGCVVDILVEVNVAGESSKFGITPKETTAFVENLSHFPNIRVKGLMTIAPYVVDAEKNRLIFATLHKLYVDITCKNIDNITMSVLSMGMTGDYTVAITEGATAVRVGTGIFGERAYAAEAVSQSD